MQVLPLAADSLGVRSMATLLEVDGTRILIDPGVMLADSRYNLPPRPDERAAYEQAVARIVGTLCQVDAVVVTHYHDDHINLLPYVLSSTAIYLKTPNSPAERRAADELFPKLQRSGRRFSLADGSSVGLRDVTLRFSPPLPHGKPGAKAGSVMAVAVQSSQGCFVHGSDLQGPLAPTAVEWVLRQRPDILYLSGAPTYKLYYQAENRSDVFSHNDLRLAKANLRTIMKYTGCQVILDHYLVRDRNFRRLTGDLFATGRVQTAAEFLGLPENLLEAGRRNGDSEQISTPVLSRPAPALAGAFFPAQPVWEDGASGLTPALASAAYSASRS